MDRDVEMARAALANVSNLPEETIASNMNDLGGEGTESAPSSAQESLIDLSSVPIQGSVTESVLSEEDPMLAASQPSFAAQLMDDTAAQVPAFQPASIVEASAPAPATEVPPRATEPVVPTMTAATEMAAAAAQPLPNRLQLIDEHQHFHTQAFQKQLGEWGMADVGFGYDLCAVLGSQSTGKSTLLNKLFGTNFDVMNERVRQQTTKGIWLSRGMNRNVLVMDVEGTDGRERGEDQDFERKSSLFALTTAECLIVNMWENQVGLYQGANMGLLKTVLDVNLSLFQSGRARSGAAVDKTLLLFVIRDYVGTTPLENLEATVRADLERIWASLSKPANLPDARLSDFFDVMFTALPHKILQPREFDAGVDALRTRFVDRSDANYVFQTHYHKRIPIDGLPHYLEGVWEQVVQNKDLDLPTQQELLAQFRCDEIAETAVRPFHSAIQVLRKVLDAGQVHPTLGQEMGTHRAAALAAFDKDASRYHQGVYARKRADLVDKLNTALLPSVLAQLKNLHTHLAERFRTNVVDTIRQSPSYNFGNVVREQHDAALRAFDETTQAMLLPDTNWSVDDERAQLDAELTKTAQTLRADESKKLAAQLQREMGKKLAEPVELALGHPTPTMWDDVLRSYNDIVADASASYLQRAASLNSTPEEDAAGLNALQRGGWRQLLAKVHQQTADAVLSVRLRAYFEERFRYDQDGVPRVWKPTDDIDGVFVNARDATLRLVPLYARIAPTDPTLLAKVEQSEQDPTYVESVRAGDEEPLDVADSLQILSELHMAEIGQRFRKDADAFYVEAKRSTVSSMSSVPWWMYAMLLVLGWNEMVAVLRNPLYFTLLCMLLAGAYAVWRLNMSGPLMRVATTLARETQQTIEDQLRAYLVPPAAAQVPPLRQEQHEMRPVGEQRDAATVHATPVAQ